MEKDKIVGIIFISIAVIFFLISQNPFDSEEEKFQKNLDRTRDIEYIKWVTDVSHDVEPHIKIITNSRNNSEIELHGRILKEDMQKHINNDKFQISPELRPLETNVKKYLEDYYNVGKLIEIGTKNNDKGSIDMASNYSKDASNIMGDMSKFIGDYMNKNNLKKR